MQLLGDQRGDGANGNQPAEHHRLVRELDDANGRLGRVDVILRVPLVGHQHTGQPGREASRQQTSEFN